MKEAGQVNSHALRIRWAEDIARAPQQITDLLQQIALETARLEFDAGEGVDMNALWDEVTRLRRLLEIGPLVIPSLETVEHEQCGGVVYGTPAGYECDTPPAPSGKRGGRRWGTI